MEMHPTPRFPRVRGTEGSPLRLAALGVAIVAFSLPACSSEPDTAGPAEVLAAYEQASDASDVDALMALYAEDAVVTGHPLDEGSPPIATGAEEIRQLELQTLGLQRTEDANDFFDIEVSGDTAVFSNRFFTDDGSCYSGSDHEITVEDGRITSYAWGIHSQPCDQ